MFQVFSELHRQKNVVLIASALLVKNHKGKKILLQFHKLFSLYDVMPCNVGKVYLSFMPATYVYYNPKYEEVH